MSGGEVMLIVITGLSSSGKSRRLRELKKLKGQDWWIGDEWQGYKQEQSQLREELYDRLVEQRCAVESAGFSPPGKLEWFLEELDSRLQGIPRAVEFFDNDPLGSIRLALADPCKRYGEDGALARVAQILCDCKRYRPDPSIGSITPIYPRKDGDGPILYTPGSDPPTDHRLDEIRKLLRRADGQTRRGADFRLSEMDAEEQNSLIRAVSAILSL